MHCLAVYFNRRRDRVPLRCTAEDVKRMCREFERFYPKTTFTADTSEKPCFKGSNGKVFQFQSAARCEKNANAFWLDALDLNTSHYSVAVCFQTAPTPQREDLNIFCRVFENIILTPQHKIYLNAHRKKWGWRKYKNITL